MRLHVRGRSLPDEAPVEYWTVDGRISIEPVHDAQTVFGATGFDGWILPGLVDSHCHLGIGTQSVGLAEAIAYAETERRAGVLLIRDPGVPIDTGSLDGRADLPRIIRGGRHLAKSKRYIPGLAIDVDDESQLPEAVAAQAIQSDGWVKLVGDWIDRSVGDLAPLWSDAILVEAIAAAHAHGARVTAHVFGEEALPGLIRAGIDAIEHGTGITDDVIALMLEHRTAVVPTLINIDNFPGIADAAAKYPTYAAHMRDLYKRSRLRLGAAREAGVAIYAGTDAGGMIAHGRIADEVAALGGIGMNATDAIGAASWAARNWLGAPALEHGAPADLVCFATDPRDGAEVLGRPDLVMLGGRVW